MLESCVRFLFIKVFWAPLPEMTLQKVWEAARAFVFFKGSRGNSVALPRLRKKDFGGKCIESLVMGSYSMTPADSGGF